ncbi:MAG TPA: proton-conducting membrane transporter [Planctomycetaceae bacterium]|nr:proton-conducting membrane transporter [Planctomycetaceae bacterium]
MIDTLLATHGTDKGALIPLLQAIQREYRYLPRKVLEELCRRTEITPADLVGVATFYDQFRQEPVGEHMIHVCTGTACHVKGADRVLEAFRQHLRIPANGDTDPAGKFTIQKVACLGCCTLAPVVQIDHLTYGHLNASMIPDVIDDFLEHADESTQHTADGPGTKGTEIILVRIGLGSCCQAQGSAKVHEELVRLIARYALPVRVEPVGCVGMCHQTPLLETVSKKGISTFYAKVRPEDVREILFHHHSPDLRHRLRHGFWNMLQRIWSNEHSDPSEKRIERTAAPMCTFLDQQRHLTMEHCGELVPTDLDDCRRHGAFVALERLLTERTTPETILDTLEQSGLRGRGGAGFPTFRKWAAVRKAAGETKYVVCNGDEGDPGAFMDRMLLESFPFRIIEGMTVAAYAVGAAQGFLYIRAEYPLAVQRIRRAIETCEQRGLLGTDILGSGFSFRLAVKEGAGAFVCGEETALLESMEGRRGMPRLRPPFPAVSGLYGQPTLVNNVETYAFIPYIMRYGVGAFVEHGTPKSRGTKVFALAGKIKRGGLIEVPMGITIRTIVEEIGGGIPVRPQDKGVPKRFKAVQIGGPSGGCVPAELADTPIDFESLSAVGAIMGSGGLVVLDEDDCMVDIARYFLAFTQEQSCGKCTFCRIGTRRMLDILDGLCAGKGTPQDLERLERLALDIKAGSLCGLGKTAPNPVLSTLKYFRGEYERHLQGHCVALKCPAMIEYAIDREKCNGCSLCAHGCAVGAIPSTPYRTHEIDRTLCTKCGSCEPLCPEGAIRRLHKQAR